MLTLAEPPSSGSGHLLKQNDGVLDTLFSDISHLEQVIEVLLGDIQQGNHLLLAEEQGLLHKNIANRLLQILNRPTEYIQLHSDTTIQSLTVQLNGETGLYEDSPLVKAIEYGHVLVVDDADKAPTNVTCSLNTLMQNGEMVLSDGRIIIPKKIIDISGRKSANFIPVHEDFRMIVMASRTGFPFLEKDLSASLVFKAGRKGTTVKAVGSGPVITTAVFGVYGTGPHTATAVATGLSVATATALTYGRGSSTATATASGSSSSTATAHSYDAGRATATVTTSGYSFAHATAEAYNAGGATATVTSTGSSNAGAVARAQDSAVATATATTSASSSVNVRAIARGNQVVTDTQSRP
ncbi:unnamed protein product [Parnassius apollo]|uniref:(apollo) hypothetical protein n=1 Tax=Parnassius apollo TaxID=110799 RepID=A0A8S3XYY5_PARAO|nr:unnamed protein product [Parnassius apollo]